MGKIIKYFSFITILFILLILIPSKSASALSGSDFKAGRIIEDGIFFNPSSLSVGDIQVFLNSKVPVCDTNGTQPYAGTTRAAYSTSKGYPPPFTCLKDYSQDTPSRSAEVNLCSDIAGGTKSSAQIIYDISQACGINAKVLITLLEKEQSLVTDDWPWSIQYRSATGYGCPDTAPCDAEYYGFFNQVYMAARQFKKYQRDSSTYRYLAYRDNYIQYNPNAGCGGTNVYIQNQATAGLYNYTPYQPNSAALNNLFGTGDGCSAYGNRNFWRIYNLWFGPSNVDVIYAQANNGNPTQYLIYNGKKQQIASYNTLLAWGIPNLPLQYLSPATLSSIPNHETPLTRYATPSASGSYYFIDNQNSYYTDFNDKNSWGSFQNEPVSVIDSKLLYLAESKGRIPIVISTDSDPNLYYIDQGYLHRIVSPTVLFALQNEGVYPANISSTYFSSMPVGIDASSPKFKFNGKTYLASGNKLFYVPDKIAGLLPSSWTDITIGSGNFARYSGAGSLSHLVRPDNSLSISLLNNGTKQPIASFSAFNNLRSSPSSYESVISKYTASLIPTGSTITSNILYSDSKYYVVNQGLREIPVNLQTIYNVPTNSVAFTGSASQIWNTGANASIFIKKLNNAGIFVADINKKYPVTSLLMYSILNGDGKEVILSDSLFNSYTYSSAMKPFISNGTSQYIIDNGSKLPATDSTANSNWEIGSPLIVTSTLTDYLSTSTQSFKQNVQTSNGEFCLVDGGRRLCAESNEIIYMYGLLSNFKPSNNLISYYGIERSGRLERFISSYLTQSYHGRVFTATNSKLIAIDTPSGLINLGYKGEALTNLNSNTIGKLFNSTDKWQGYLAKDDSNNLWVLDSGYKRFIPADLNTQWTGAFVPTSLGTKYLSGLPNQPDLTNSIKTSNGTTIYGLDNGNKRAISTYQKYTTLGYAPFSTISQNLLNSIPQGSDL